MQSLTFSREFSVQVDTHSYTCSFDKFNFERHSNVKFGAPTPVHLQEKKMVSNVSSPMAALDTFAFGSKDVHFTGEGDNIVGEEREELDKENPASRRLEERRMVKRTRRD